MRETRISHPTSRISRLASLKSELARGDALEMLGHRRLGEETPDQRAELLEIRRLPEVDRVRLDGLPANQEVIPPLGLHAALQLVRNVAGHTLEDGLDLGENGLELRYFFRLD